MFSTLFAALIASALMAGIGGGTSAIGDAVTGNNEETILKQMQEKYGLTKDQAKNLYTQYKGEGSNVSGADYLNPANWFGGWGKKDWNTDWEGLEDEMQKIQQAHDELGDLPNMPTLDELNNIRQQSYGEIDAENQRLLDLYNQSFQNSENALNRELAYNNQMFGDYRNQLLTNNAMQQQALAGSTRFELDRQQRNAITRGASAAQRLVANINTQLGLQAQSAQQSLDTSNALAQNLLAHRQAQQGVRDAYLNAQNQYNQNVASTISGQAERRFNYGQAQKQGAVDDYNYAYDAYNTGLDDRFQGDSVGRNTYLNMYGKRRGQNNSSSL